VLPVMLATIVEHPLEQRRPRPRTPHDEEERVRILRYALRGLHRSEGSLFGHAWLLSFELEPFKRRYPPARDCSPILASILQGF
jgi:hypothetical protein